MGLPSGTLKPTSPAPNSAPIGIEPEPRVWPPAADFFNGSQLDIQGTDDILRLSNLFLSEAARELGLESAPELAAATLDHLCRLPWRGNIRELRHVIKGAALRAGGSPSIVVAHLDPGPNKLETSNGSVSSLDPNLTWKERLEATEREALEQTLRSAAGNLTRGAELFGVPRTTYREKLVKNGLLDKKES